MIARRLPPLVILPLALVVTACSGSDDPPGGTPPRSGASSGPNVAAGVDPQVRDDLAALYAGDAPSVEEVEDSECFADALLGRLDGEDLAAAGITDDDGVVVAAIPLLDVPTAEAWVAAENDCTDFVEVSTRALGAQSKGKIDPAAYERCLREALTAEQVDAALVRTLTGGFDSPEVAALSQAQADCARSSQPSD